MKHRLLVIACVLGSVGAAACGPQVAEPSLDGRVFLAQSVTEGGAPRALVPGTELWLEFREAPRVSATAGCNSMASRYSIDDGVFVLGEMTITAIGCDAERHAQDDWYYGFLGSKPEITIDGSELVLDGSGTRIEYLDREVATPDVELTGRTWTVDTVIQGEVASHAEWPTPATLVFDSDGTVAVNTGCNSGEGSYQVSGAELTFSSIAVTERGCDGLAGELETAVLAVLHGPQPVTWEISASRLSLRNPSAGLDLVASDG